MAQKPRHQTEDFRQLIWEVIKAADAPITRAALHHTTGIAPSTIANYLKALVAGGVLERLEGKDGFGPPPPPIG